MADSFYVLGVDLGGSKIAAAVFDSEHRQLSDVHVLPTMANQSVKLTLMNLKRVISQAIRSSRCMGSPAAIGMSSPGYFDVTHGCVLADNLPNLRGFPLRRFIKEEFGSPLFLENDANCFTLAETLRGAGVGHNIVIGVTIGTGFGCGLTIGGKIHRGNSGNAGEVAHCSVAKGSFDDTLSGRGVRRFYEGVIGVAGDTFSAFERGSNIRTDTPSAKEIGEMAAAGDPNAIETWKLFGRALGEAIGMIVSVIDPAVCVIGGSVAKSFNLFQPVLRSTLSGVVAREASRVLRVEPAHLGTAAGVIGAAEQALGARPSD